MQKRAQSVDVLVQKNSRRYLWYLYFRKYHVSILIRTEDAETLLNQLYFEWYIILTCKSG